MLPHLSRAPATQRTLPRPEAAAATSDASRARTAAPADYRTAYACFALAWLVLASPWLSGSVTIPWDAKALFQAQIQFLANALHSGQSPFWSPNVFVGLPQIADPQSLIFSPAVILAYFDAVPSFLQLDIYVTALLGLGGLALLELFRDQDWHPAGAALTAIAFAFGASAAWRIQHIGQIQSYVLFAVALWLLNRALTRSSVAWGALAGVAVGVMLAEPNQVALLACYVLGAIVLGHWLIGPNPAARLRASTLPLACTAAVAALIAAIPLLMTFLYVETSNRPVVAFSEAVRGSLHPASLLTALVSDLYGAFDPKVPYWGPYSEAWNPQELTLSQNMSQLYLGALPVVLVALVGLSGRLLWAREVRPAVLAVAGLLVYALGSYTPVFQALFDVLPGVALFRRPADATFLLGGMLAVVAGYLLHRHLSETPPPISRSQLGWAGGLLAVPIGLAIAVAAASGQLGHAVKPILLAGGWLAAALALLIAVRRLGAGRPIFVIAAPALLLTVDLATNNGPNESTAQPAANYDILKPNCRNETIRFLKAMVRRAPGSQWRDRIELVGLGFEWPNSTLVHGFDHTLGYNPLRMGIVSTALGAKDHIAGPDQREFTPLFPSYRSLLADLLGLRFIASSVPIEQVDTRLPRGGLKLVAHTADAYIYENRDALPRVLFATRAFPADFERLLKDGRWPQFDPNDTVLLDQNDVPSYERGVALSPASGYSSVRITRYENTVVDVAVDATEAGFVVLNDVWHPWWTAEVNGHPATILKANVMFRAVPVPAGRHHVRFEFRPFSGAVAELRETTARLGAR